MSNNTGNSRPARAEMGDDIAVAFTVDALNVRGRIVRLGKAVDTAIRQHAYPAPVSRLLGEVMALAALLGASLKFDGKLIVQAETDGPVSMLVADFTTPGFIRGLARFDDAALAALPDKDARDAAKLLGKGHLAFTIDQGKETERYQGVVAFTGSLANAAQEYFEKSEQIPTLVKLAAGQLSGADGEHWRAGAAMIQHLPPASGEAAAGDEDDWPRASALFDTLEDHELLDPGLSPERLLFQLFHEDGVRAFDPLPITWRCGCSREGLLATLRNFSREDRAHMVRDGKITARCQFCSREYVFSPEELEAKAGD